VLTRSVVAVLGASLVLAGLTGGLGTTSSDAAPTTAKSGKLSTRLAQLATPALVRAGRASQAAALDLPARGAGSLMRREGGSLLTYVRVSDTSAATVAAIRGAGATIVHVSPDYRVVTAAVPAARLDTVGRLAQVDYVSEALAPTVAPVTAKATRNSGTAATCGKATSEGDGVLKAATTRSAYGVDGSGVKVGVLSDSWDIDPSDATSAAQDVKSGDLPGATNPCGRKTPVQVLHEATLDEGGADEGRAMAQLVHDLAPGATLMFSTAFDGEFAMADYIVELYRKGATVITDDITYYSEPFYQRGAIGNAVRYVSQRGVVYTSSAGNSNTVFTHPKVGPKDVGAYDTLAYRPTACPAGIPKGTKRTCHDFDGTSKTDPSLSFNVSSGGVMTVDYQNAQPVDGITTDFDLYLLDRGTHDTLAVSDNNNPASKSSFEILQWQNDTGRSRVVDLVVVRDTGTRKPAMRMVFFDLTGLQGVERPVGSGGDVVGRYETFGHNADPDALTTAAADWATPSKPQQYSSRGPLRWVFNPVSPSGKPAKAFAKPKVVAKPDVTAVDRTLTTFFYGPSHRFSGTSAAAPHVAAVAALLFDVKPGVSGFAVRRAIKESVVKLSYTPNSVGLGRVDAYAAAKKLAPVPDPATTAGRQQAPR
jgi:hypothetical protein